MRTAALITDFTTSRLGVIMSPKAGEPHEAWGVLNPAGIRSPDGAMHLFPRLIAEGNYSRIGHTRVRFDGETPVGVERLGIALGPRESYERSPGGGGVEDPRVVYVPLLKRYVMTYTAFVPYEPRVAIAISDDLQSWATSWGLAVRRNCRRSRTQCVRLQRRVALPRCHLRSGAVSVVAPEAEYERDGLVSDVVFPSSTDLRPDGRSTSITARPIMSSPRRALPCPVSCPRR
jgi:predicted GH43/DUF377 family glycosyl hydrolase